MHCKVISWVLTWSAGLVISLLLRESSNLQARNPKAKEIKQVRIVRTGIPYMYSVFN
jgi:hypothetical protein